MANMPLKDYAHRLDQVSVLLADKDRQILTIVRDILRNFGFKKILTTTDGAEALRIMKTNPVDLAISEWEIERVDGLSMLHYLRSASQVAFRYKPVIMLTGHSDERDVLAARDAGVTEYVIKPFTAANLVQRIRTAIDHPRNFVWSPQFKGPDRRRKGQVPAGQVDKRSKKETPLVKKELSQVMPDDQVRMVIAGHDLKDKIGHDINLDQVFTEERVAKAQEVIQASVEDFLKWFAEDCHALEAAEKAFQQSGLQDKSARLQLNDSAFSIKARAGTFGYDCASLAANSLYQFLRRHDQIIPDHLVVIQKHIETLHTILTQDISGLGGAIGQELLQKLNLLTKKFP